MTAHVTVDNGHLRIQRTEAVQLIVSLYFEYISNVQ